MNLAVRFLLEIFAVPNDPSRSGSAPVPVPGIVRLAIELAYFAAAAWGLYDRGFSRLAVAARGIRMHRVRERSLSPRFIQENLEH